LCTSWLVLSTAASFAGQRGLSPPLEISSFTQI
jgi:hypothetical protein